MGNPVIETRNILIWLDEAGIVRIVTKPGLTKQLVSDAEENLAAFEQVRLGKKRRVLADIREELSTDSAGRRLYSQARLGEVVSAVAFIVGSPLSRVIGSFYLGVNKPPFPVALFTSESEALEWLKRF